MKSVYLSVLPFILRSVTAAPTDSLAPLNDLAVAKGKEFFGVSVTTDALANATYRANLDNTRLFGT
jgi:hypothetical protein